MPKIEVDELEWNNSVQMREAIKKMMANPKAAVLVEEAHKMVEPTAPTPNLEKRKEVLEPYEKLAKEFDDYKKQTAEEKAKAEQDAKLAALQTKIDKGNAKLLSEGWTADGIKALDEFREKEGILDPIAAAAYYEKLNGPAVVPVTPSSGNTGAAWNFTDLPKDGADDLKKLLETRGDSDSLTMKMAHDALNEFRQQVRGGR